MADQPLAESDYPTPYDPDDADEAEFLGIPAPETTESDVASVFASKLFEWLAEFGVDNASERARLVATSFVRDGWTRPSNPPESRSTDGRARE